MVLSAIAGLSIGTILLIVGGFLFFGKKANKTLAIGLLVVGFLMGGLTGLGQLSLGGTDTAGTSGGTGTVNNFRTGASSTVTLNSFTGTWGGLSSKTEVYTNYHLLDQTGAVLVNDVNANTSTMAVGDSGTLYCTGGDFYCDKTTFSVSKESQTQDIQAKQIATVANMDVVVYDNTGSTALTADSNASATNDYSSADMGAGETDVIYVKFQNKVADRTFRLGAILTWECDAGTTTKIDDFTLTESGWKEVALPSGDLQDTFRQDNSTDSNVECHYKHAYVPSSSSFIELSEWDYIKVQMTIDADDSNAPAVEDNAFVGGTFVDYGCNPDSTGAVICDWYNHDTNNDPDDIALDDAVIATNFDGLNTGFSIDVI